VCRLNDFADSSVRQVFCFDCSGSISADNVVYAAEGEVKCHQKDSNEAASFLWVDATKAQTFL
jgi:hypothetical protein